MESLAKAAAEREEFDKLVVRTHFGDDAAWQAVLAAAAQPWGDEDDQQDEDFESTTYAVDDPRLAGWPIEQVKQAVAEQDPHLRVLFLADEESMRAPHHALLAVDLDEESADEPFRIVPRQASGVHVNLTLANMDFDEWADTAKAHPDGVFHDFR